MKRTRIILGVLAIWAAAAWAQFDSPFPFETTSASLSASGGNDAFSWTWSRETDQKVVAQVSSGAGISNIAFRLARGGSHYLTLAGGSWDGATYTAFAARTNLPAAGMYEAEFLAASHTNTALGYTRILARGSVEILASIFSLTNAAGTCSVSVAYVLTGGEGSGGSSTNVSYDNLNRNGGVGLASNTVYRGDYGASASNKAATAFGWGDHSAAGYLTSFTEADPLWAAVSNRYRIGTNVLTDMNGTNLAYNGVGLRDGVGAGDTPTDTSGLSNALVVAARVASNALSRSGGGTVTGMVALAAENNGAETSFPIVFNEQPGQSNTLRSVGGRLRVYGIDGDFELLREDAVTDFLLLSAFQSSQAMTNTIRMSVASPQFLYLVLSNNVAGGAVTTQRIMQVFQQ